MCLVLRLRLNRRVEELVEQAFGGVESFQAYLNEHSSWMYQQQEVKYLNGKRIPLRASTILLCERVKLVLSPPVITEANNGKDLPISIGSSRFCSRIEMIGLTRWRAEKSRSQSRSNLTCPSGPNAPLRPQR